MDETPKKRYPGGETGLGEEQRLLQGFLDFSAKNKTKQNNIHYKMKIRASPWHHSKKKLNTSTRTRAGAGGSPETWCPGGEAGTVEFDLPRGGEVSLVLSKQAVQIRLSELQHDRDNSLVPVHLDR